MPSVLSTIALVISKIPLLIDAIISHVLGLTPTASKWDLRTAVIVTALRDYLANATPSTISEQQAMLSRDPGIKSKIWVAKATLAAPPEDDVREQLFAAIKALGNGREQYMPPPLQDVTGEWVGVRAGVSDSEKEPKGMSEKEKYECIAKEAKSSTTILYTHGGSLYLMDPVSTRPNALSYAKYSQGRVFSVRYRLAPQGPFPGALLDVLVAYLSLLHPPPGSLHEPVSASDIVLCGDSGGGNIALSFLQLLLQLHRAAPKNQLPTVRFHGASVAVPLPGAVGLNSPSCDITRSMHWEMAVKTYDYLPGPQMSPVTSPPCAVWPSDPPRVDLYADGSCLAHPLVTPLAAASWEGSPPVQFIVGEEIVAGECKLLAGLMARQGVKVVWEQFEAMPHCFNLFLTWLDAAPLSYDDWAAFIRRVREGTVETEGSFVAAKTLVRTKEDVKGFYVIPHEEVLINLESYKRGIEERYAYLLK